ncbi:MAG: hypothetical protein WC807_14140 [Hyphomicrobium sp.]|jgi:hypothetical protein
MRLDSRLLRPIFTMAVIALAATARPVMAEDWKPVVTPEMAAEAEIDRAPAATPDAKAPEKAAAATAAPAPQDDYYGRRAKSLIAQENEARLKPHPLALANPGKLVVVCEAGCGLSDKPEIVYMTPVKASVLSSGAMMVPTSETPVDAKASSIECAAGCYDGPKSYAARVPEPATSVAATPPAAFVTPKKRDHLSPVR